MKAAQLPRFRKSLLFCCHGKGNARRQNWRLRYARLKEEASKRLQCTVA